MRFYCPKCWQDFGDDFQRCPRCGLDILAYSNTKDWVGKLIDALEHPEPETVIRVVGILGTLRNARAIAPLIRLIQKTKDVYVARAAIGALSRFDTAESRRFLKKVASSHPASVIRKAAADAVITRGNSSDSVTTIWRD